ncbi:hypothetical protein J3Q64DRAFT_1706640 [Phycomyces blakesleeanus]|uniref:Uncharacterized protein n=2 Tax=Phycomyces blakesleeanus TaxID=4837 RepID=A0A167PDZ7_PHYB8|nr:hypothetical protein PHYBLDRAFT_141600 [Phycomyces blakesleeanus NRRL 1555(-)]OAD77736.1 hypothetical protein PHYBLDRAFT_141600 [Phycomyces blakesleeanus NRRL 1555(-)]|eukprot:XP_018295776.1 hypothetical protein PHYBLDRAFT_141600 [Phycomyces blakesleeanus NRRL 1555(-)]
MKTSSIAVLALLGLSLVNSAPLSETQAVNGTLPELAPVSHTIVEMYKNGVDPSMNNFTASASIEILGFPQPTGASEITIQSLSSDAMPMTTPINGVLLTTAMTVTAMAFIIAF